MYLKYVNIANRTIYVKCMFQIKDLVIFISYYIVIQCYMFTIYYAPFRLSKVLYALIKAKTYTRYSEKQLLVNNVVRLPDFAGNKIQVLIYYLIERTSIYPQWMPKDALLNPCRDIRFLRHSVAQRRGPPRVYLKNQLSNFDLKLCAEKGLNETSLF